MLTEWWLHGSFSHWSLLTQYNVGTFNTKSAADGNCLLLITMVAQYAMDSWCEKWSFAKKWGSRLTLTLCLPCFIALEEHILMPITVHLAVKCSCLHLNARQNDRAKGDYLQLKHRNCTACFDPFNNRWKDILSFRQAFVCFVFCVVSPGSCEIILNTYQLFSFFNWYLCKIFHDWFPVYWSAMQIHFTYFLL